MYISGPGTFGCVLTMVTCNTGLWAYKDLELNHAMLCSALLVAVIVGSMRTTRRVTLQLLSFSAGELWWKMWLYSPHRFVWSGVKKALPPGVSRKLRSAVRTTSKMVLGRSAWRRTVRYKVSLKHGLHLHRVRHVSSTVSCSCLYFVIVL